jgi:hypothetical protein
MKTPVRIVPVADVAHPVEVGPDLQIEPATTVPILKSSKTCAFLLSIGETSVSVDFLNVQRLTINFPAAKTIVLIETAFIRTSYATIISSVSFPSPIVIANVLDQPISAYQLCPQSSFTIEPFSTSIYAFDDPMLHPSVHICLEREGQQIAMHLSLQSDMDQTSIHSLFVSLRRMKNNARVVFVRDTPEVFSPNRHFEISLFIPGIGISLIDRELREIVHVALSQISAPCRSIFAP